MKQKFLALLLILCLLLTGCEYGIVFETVPPSSRPAETAGPGEDTQTLLIHFIDVGQADCALIEYGAFYILIDGGNVEDGQMVVSYLEQQGVRELSAVICTHAHEDHVGGLPSVLAVYPTEKVFAPTRTYSSNVFDDFLYYTDQQGLTVTIPSPGDMLTYSDGITELTLTVLGPTRSYAETNDTSIVVRVEYGGTSFLFTGDMEVAAENDMLDYWADRWQSVDVLKVGHHGSDTSTGYRFLYEVNPAYAVISAGQGNSYGHPHEEPMSRLYHAGCTIFRTDEMGTIVAASDGREITFTWENQNALPANGEIGDTRLIGNIKSMKLHTSLCNYLPGDENRVYFESYQEAIAAGYIPCRSCME